MSDPATDCSVSSGGRSVLPEELISVVIPCFNRADVISRAVDSVLRQTHRNLEVIVVDDASEDSDGLEAAIAGMNDARIRLLKHKTNQGGAAARNTGVTAAKGEWVAFLDSDDEWHPEKLEKQLEFAAMLPSDKCLIYCQSEVLTTQSAGVQQSVMPMRAIRADEAIGDYLFADRGWLPTPSFFLPRKLACEVSFNPALRRHQDYDLLLRLEDAGCSFHMIQEKLVTVHWEDLHQTSRGLNPERSLCFIEEYRSMLSPKAQSGFVYSQVVSRLLREGRRGEALSIAMKQVRFWHLSAATLIGALSLFVFRDARLAVSGARLKKKIKA
ncbi:glycosyltransferase family 2 protein [Akkermansiaceae bacterium]|nr:glycosyltransferase family 2 protein [Akkermansiaceae bacterium]